MPKIKKQLIAPASEKQRMILQATEDIVLVGGGKTCASTLNKLS